MPHDPGTQVALRAVVQRPFGLEVANLVIDGLQDEFCVPRQNSESDDRIERSLVLQRSRWVIRDDDLALVSTICDSFRSATGSGLLGAMFAPAAEATPIIGAAAGAIAAILVNVITLLRRVIRKGAVVASHHVKILSVLKAFSGGTSLADLTTELARMDSSAEPPWGEGIVTQYLSELSALVLSDGTSVALVARDHNGQWYASRV